MDLNETNWLRKQQHFDWMQKCLVCWQKCEEFIAWSIENGKHISSINACRDATEMCSQCIKFEAQRSPFFKQLCDVCSEICEKFASDLEKFETKTGIILETIISCKIFAAACRKIEENMNVPYPNNEFIQKRGDDI